MRGRAEARLADQAAAVRLDAAIASLTAAPTSAAGSWIFGKATAGAGDLPLLENAASSVRASRFIASMSVGIEAERCGIGGLARTTGGGAAAMAGRGMVIGVSAGLRFPCIASRIFRHCSPARLRATALER